MAWYPAAKKMELQPESDAQPAIRPTQFIVHSIAAPWTKERIYEYWRDDSNLESHFGQSFDGSIAQYIGTETRADASYKANRRPDGTGAVSIETASNLQHTDPWTDAQVEGLIRLGVWLHQRHGIPLRICRTADDPGYGYHRLHAAWAVSGTACPGDARVKQFKEQVFPGIVARATGHQPPEEDDMPTAAEIAHAVWSHTETGPTGSKPVRTGAVIGWMDTVHGNQVAALKALDIKVNALSAAVAALAKVIGDGNDDVDTAQVVAAVRAAIAEAVIDVDVNINGRES
ncbi:N-acetylmuramoyl-L-alanine amidase [Streptomyces sp. NBC_00237]|uniref:peptidoglycan recognition protein family protein n=1 Tax=Streptomyces sp. NBC_00237 TaxID=2975687 RepID=UPI00224F65C0|nr:N-acetylmuramoyl-L-alanine amidase [Streptomyces sp. NBC_00237]MCX5202500.1 N-acetylmuramoyl-L-alanine amidase [Streptomyces sp. NBC_00237]